MSIDEQTQTVLSSTSQEAAQSADTQYEDLLAKVMGTGAVKADRTGTGTYSLFGQTLRYDLSKGFPLITTKRVHLHSVVTELLWFLRGDTNIRWLQEHGVRIWNEWADENGDLGPVYGSMWRSWPNPDGTTIDQVSQLLDTLRTNPDSRRMLVTAWNPSSVDKAALAPCHVMVQFYVARGQLSCHLYQRSADLFLGVPFNIASYALLTHLIADQVGLEAGEFVWTGGDCHIYANHTEQVLTQIERMPFPFPQVQITARPSLFEHEPSDVSVVGYQHHPGIKAPVAV